MYLGSSLWINLPHGFTSHAATNSKATRTEIKSFLCENNVVLLLLNKVREVGLCYLQPPLVGNLAGIPQRGFEMTLEISGQSGGDASGKATVGTKSRKSRHFDGQANDPSEVIQGF